MVIDHDDADDLIQDTFVKIWKNLPGFRSDAQLYTWMYRIATNECITFLNKKKQKNNIPLDDVAYELADSLADSSYFNGDQAQRKLQQAILTLPEKQRHASLLPLLHNYQKPQKPINGSMAPTDRFRAAVQDAKVGPDKDIPHISPPIIAKYVSDLRLLGLL